jgi:hypothetical protein
VSPRHAIYPTFRFCERRRRPDTPIVLRESSATPRQDNSPRTGPPDLLQAADERRRLSRQVKLNARNSRARPLHLGRLSPRLWLREEAPAMSGPDDRRKPEKTDRRARSRGGRRADDPSHSAYASTVSCRACEGGVATLVGVSTTPGSLVLIYRCATCGYELRWDTKDGPLPR